MSDRPETPLLDTVNVPADIRALTKEQLPQLADELRQEVISAVSVTGGHLGAGLGVVELTVAAHYVFDTPDDRLIWDVGHQAYPHKIVTGRRDRIRTLRQGGGLSGFTRRSESEYDPFGAAHSSTSISSALGFAIANKLSGSPGKAIAVIGDGALSAGMAYEAMNNAAAAGNRLVVILNDNDMSIAPPVGSLRNSLARLVSSQKYLTPRRFAQKLARAMPDPLHSGLRRMEEYTRGWMTGGTLFEELGFYYVGPVDGHDVRALVEVLENVRDADIGPMLVHVVTKKGKGYAPAENSADKYHGVVKFDVVSGVQAKPAAGTPSYTSVFAKALSTEMARDEKVVAITAAMPSGTGLDKIERAIPRPHLRRRHRRAACGDLRRRACRARDEAVRGHLFDLPPTRVRPGRPRHCDPEFAGALCDGPGGFGRCRRGDARRQLRPRLSVHASEFRRDGRGGRG